MKDKFSCREIDPGGRNGRYSRVIIERVLSCVGLPSASTVSFLEGGEANEVEMTVRGNNIGG